SDNSEAWGDVLSEGWVVCSLKGMLINTTTYGLGQVLDPEVVRANFTPWSMQKLVNAGIVTHPGLGPSTTPVPAGPWSVLGLRSAGTGESATTEEATDEASAPEQRDEDQ